MSTAKAVIESLPTPQLRGLPSRKAASAERVSKIRDLATGLLDEAESLDHDNGPPRCLDLRESRLKSR
jgi:hypothetical protein